MATHDKGLDALARFRHLARDQARLELAKVDKRVQGIAQARAQLSRDLTAERAVRGETPFDDAIAYGRFVESARAREIDWQRQERALDELRQQAARQLADCERGVEQVERLLEAKRRDRRVLMERAEAKAFDELATIRFAARRSEDPV
ncbi:MAG: flagellar FliJ family protein [Geminicoccaceae bacterium]